MPTPYQVNCTCGKILDVMKREMDKDGDVIVDVEPCPDCLADAAKEAESRADKQSSE